MDTTEQTKTDETKVEVLEPETQVTEEKPTTPTTPETPDCKESKPPTPKPEDPKVKEEVENQHRRVRKQPGGGTTC